MSLLWPESHSVFAQRTKSEGRGSRYVCVDNCKFHPTTILVNLDILGMGHYAKNNRRNFILV